MTDLKTLVRERVDVQWEAWAARHPNLAAAIDRVQLTESTVTRLRSDPAFVEAMRQASLDESQLIGAVRVIEVIERLIRAGMRL